MKRLILTLSVLVATLLPGFALAGNAGAVDVFKDCGEGSAQGNPAVCNSVDSQKSSGSNPIIRIIKTAITIVSYVAGAAAVILIVVSGIQFATAGGDSNNAAGARRTLVYALVGLVVVALSQAIVAFVLDKV